MKKKNHIIIVLIEMMTLVAMSFSLAFATEYVKGHPATDIELNTWYSGLSGDTEYNTPYYCFTTSPRNDSSYVITLKNTSAYGLDVNKWGYDSQYGWWTEGWGVPSADPYNTTSYTYSSGSLKANCKYCLQVWSKGLAGSGDRGTFEIQVQEIVSNPTDNSSNNSANATDNINSNNASVSSTIAETIDLPTVKIAKPKVAKKSATIKWKKVSKKNQKKIAKIQIQYSMDPSFQTGVKTTTAKKSAISKRIKKLTSKNTYYVRVRAYKVTGGVTHASNWSAVKKVKVK